MPKRTTGGGPDLKPVNLGAAAIDIGSKMHMAVVNPACTDTPVRAFGTSGKTCISWRTGSRHAA
ncbi:hypothetical protein ABIB73_007569 [Bradyrhizobium sp. F1.4.3]